MAWECGFVRLLLTGVCSLSRLCIRMLLACPLLEGKAVSLSDRWLRPSVSERLVYLNSRK